LGGETFLSTEETHPLCRGCFHADAFQRQTEHVGSSLAHALAMRADLWALA
jgi:hypothetical protein